MRKRNMIPALAVISGIAGAVLRKVQMSTVIESDTGFARPGAPITVILTALAIAAALAFAAFSLRLRRSAPRGRGYAAAFGQENIVFTALLAVFGALVILGGAVYWLLGRHDGALGAILALFMVVSGAAIVLSAWCVRLENSAGVAEYLSMAPGAFCCMFLILTYRDYSTDPQVLDYAFEALAAGTAALAFCWQAGFAFGKISSGLTIWFSSLGAFFCFVTLGDSHPLWKTLVFFGLGGSLAILLAAFLSALEDGPPDDTNGPNDGGDGQEERDGAESPDNAGDSDEGPGAKKTGTAENIWGSPVTFVKEEKMDRQLMDLFQPARSTRRLYYEDSHLAEFEAEVISCMPGEKGFEMELDQTAFFPEGGGQPGDAGVIGAAQVLDTQEKGDRIIHYTDFPLATGQRVRCRIDWETRFGRMQNHSGEHLVSGIVYKLYGLGNIGFHMDKDGTVIDFGAYLTREQLDEIEDLANQAVLKNLPVRAYFPTEGELGKTDYRSKKELTGQVRLVTIEGLDACACCAPHVKTTGEIGMVRILDSARHRGGVRIRMVCGRAALEDYRKKTHEAERVSALLSAKQDDLAGAVERVLSELEGMKHALKAANLELARVKAAGIEESGGNICFFDDRLDAESLREVVNMGMDRCGGIFAAFSGNDTDGYRYVIGSRSVDLPSAAGEINRAISGRGGGRGEMIQGSASAARAEIEAYFLKS